MSNKGVDDMLFSTIRTHSKNGSLAGRVPLLPGLRLSMYYCDLFIP